MQRKYLTKDVWVGQVRAEPVDIRDNREEPMTPVVEYLQKQLEAMSDECSIRSMDEGKAC